MDCHTSDIPESTVVPMRGSLPVKQNLMDTAHLRETKNRRNLTQAVVEAGLDELHARRALRYCTMISQEPQPLGQVTIVGGYHAAFPTGDHLPWMETKTTHGAMSATPNVVTGGTQRAGRIDYESGPHIVSQSR
jgi:hypothetical protein